MKSYGMVALKLISLAFTTGSFLLTGCRLKNPYAPEEFPKTDIVYQISTTRGGVGKETLGFVNADGTGTELLEISVPNIWGGELAPIYPIFINEDIMIFRISPMWGHPSELVLAQENQRMMKCKIQVGSERPTLTSDEMVVLTDVIRPPGGLILYELNNCDQETDLEEMTLFETGSENLWVSSGALSPDGNTLAISFLEKPGDKYRVLIRDLSTGEKNILTTPSHRPGPLMESGWHIPIQREYL